jgi:alkylated DNA nucleotide flippase Atl1
MRERQPANIEPTPVAVTVTEQPVYDLNNERQRQVLERLEEGFEQAATDDGMVTWLRVISKFHDYSLNNTVLILVQRPDATQVMGYGDKEGRSGWKSLGRQVRKDEQAIRIFAPQHRVVRARDEITGEEQMHQVLTGFRVVSVFDIAQTDGTPLPDHPGAAAITALERSDERAAEVNKRLSWWLIDQGLTVSSEPMHGHKQGYYSPNTRKVAIRKAETVDPLSIQLTKTLVHEAAHYAAGHAGGMDRGAAEVVAECSAFVVMDRYGVDTGAYSFTYAAGWAKGDARLLKQAMGDIKQVSGTLINAIEQTTYEPTASMLPERFPEEDEHLSSRESEENRPDQKEW